MYILLQNWFQKPQLLFHHYFTISYIPILIISIILGWIFNLSTLWTVARQAPLSTKFFRQEYWNGVSSYSHSRGSSGLRDWTWVSCIAGRFFIIWATRSAIANFNLGLRIWIPAGQWSICSNSEQLLCCYYNGWWSYSIMLIKWNSFTQTLFF